jgi:hypothetical protein
MALLDDIEEFLREHDDLSPTALGDRSLGDRHFVRQLRNGRRVWPETEAKVREFMAAYRTGAENPSPGKADRISHENQVVG